MTQALMKQEITRRKQMADCARSSVRHLVDSWNAEVKQGLWKPKRQLVQLLQRQCDDVTTIANRRNSSNLMNEIVAQVRSDG